MGLPGSKFFLAIPALACALLAPGNLLAQSQNPPNSGTSGATLNAGVASGMIGSVDLDVSVKGPGGIAIEGVAVVTLLGMNGKPLRQETTKGGAVRFYGLAATEYNIQVVAPAYERVVKRVDAQNGSSMKVSIELRPSDAEDAAFAVGMRALNSKAQKEVGKAIEELRSNKPAEARRHLDVAYRLSPKSAEVQYLYGLYSSSVGDHTQAKSYWTKTLEIYPQHFGALVSLSEVLLRENKSSEALPYLEQAIRAQPTVWRAHAVLAEAYLRQGSSEEAIREAERALELGHARAAIVQPVLAAALVKHGDTDRAATILQAYLQEHPGDIDAKKQLMFLQTPRTQNAANEAGVANGETILTPTTQEGIADVLPSSWLPPDIDEKVGSVEPGAACALEEVMKNAGARIEEFVRNVDRFAATESVNHESINKSGIASYPVTRKFDYLVAVQEMRPGFFNVDEYRTSTNSNSDFPAGIATNGLPAMVLIFHPHSAGSFQFICEGLARWNGGLAWQIHFRQRADKPNTIRRYRLGAQGRAYPVALKGRAWIAADTYQIVRMETQEIAPVAEIRLTTDRTAIEYGPVHFKERNLDMWLPQSAEVFVDWRGKRFHRRHSFSKYLLFSVDEKQKISAPKIAEETPASPAGEKSKPNP